MKLITHEESLQEVNAGAGVSCFVGGWESKNGKQILILNDENYLFEANEVNGEEWKKMVNEQNKEAEAYVESYEDVE